MKPLRILGFVLGGAAVCAAGAAAAFGLAATPTNPPTTKPTTHPCPPNNPHCGGGGGGGSTDPQGETTTPEVTTEVTPPTTTDAETTVVTTTTAPPTTAATTTTGTTVGTTTPTTPGGSPAGTPPPGDTDAAPSGNVKVKLPGSDEFVSLGKAARLPDGTTVDTTTGKVTLETSDGGVGTFNGSVFVIESATDRGHLTQLRLVGGNFSTCTAARHVSATGKSRKPVRSLWGKAKGRFRTKARQAAATVRGTFWLTQDRCDGTFVRVVEGRVEVLQYRPRRTVVLTAGKSYLAPAP